MAKEPKTDSMPAEGKAAPAFTLEADDGTKVKLSSFKGEKNVVLYFYPKDDTPGCTTEACAFRDDRPKFDRADTIILGVSPDPVKKHVKFKEKYDLNFMLLADPETTVAQKYGVWTEKSMYGRTYMGIQRATFLIDKDGKIAKVWPKVKVAGHSAEVLAAVKELP